MNKTLKTLLSGLMVAGLCLLVAPSVEAAAIRVIDVASSTVVIISDNDPSLDAIPFLGAIAHTGSIGNFFLEFEFGVTKPLIGDPTEPLMALTILASSGGAGGTLVIDFSETGFGPTGLQMSASAEGVTSGFVTYETYQHSGNVLFGDVALGGVLLTSSGPAGPGVIVFNDTGLLSTGGFPYSLTQRLIITHAAGPQITSIGIDPDQPAILAVPDGGLALSLLGFALVGVEGLRRKFRKPSA